jgi:hypothetical protein
MSKIKEGPFEEKIANIMLSDTDPDPTWLKV